MSDLNQCTFTGRLGADPEIRKTRDGRDVANFRLAVSERWKDRNTGERREKTEWVSCVVFSKGFCHILEQYVKKGSRVLVQGRYQTREWEDQSGNKRWSTECVLQGFDSKLIMLDPPSGGQQQEQRQDQREPDRSGGQRDDMDSEIPF